MKPACRHCGEIEGAGKGMMTYAKKLEAMTNDRNEWRQQHENLLSVRQSDLAAIADQLRQAVEDEAQNPWKRAIIDAAVVNWSYKKEHDSDPRAALNDLLAMEDNYVLDPQISERMAIALRQAKVEVLRKYRDSFCWDSSYPGTYRDGLDALIDEIERSKT